MGNDIQVFKLSDRLQLSFAVRDWPLAQRALETAKKELAANTLDSYGRKWKRWLAWCEVYGLAPLPVDPERLVTWLQDEIEGGRERTWIQQAISALTKVDSYARGQGAAPLNDHPFVRAWWKGYRRDKPTRTRCSPYLSPDQLRAAVHSLYSPRARYSRATMFAQARNRFLINLGYLAAMRREELVALRVRDLSFTDRGLLVYFARSKTDQEGVGCEREILAQSEAMLCPVDAWNIWKIILRNEGCDGPDAHVFPPIHSEKLAAVPMWPRSLNKVFDDLSHVAKLDVTPHSLRAAFATHAKIAGHEDSEIAYHGRWKSIACMQRYVRRERIGWGKNPTKGLALLGARRESQDDRETSDR